MAATLLTSALEAAMAGMEKAHKQVKEDRRAKAHPDSKPNPLTPMFQSKKPFYVYFRILHAYTIIYLKYRVYC